MCQPLVQTCAGTSLRGDKGMVGGKKISQRLKGLMSSKREDALSTEMIKKSRWRLRSSRDLNLFMSLGLLQSLDSCVACIEIR